MFERNTSYVYGYWQSDEIYYDSYGKYERQGYFLWHATILWATSSIHFHHGSREICQESTLLLGSNSSFIVASWGPAISRVVKAAKQTSNPRLHSTCRFLPFQSQIHNLVRDSVSTSAVTLLSDSELDTLTLGQRDPGLVLANDENVALTGSKAVVNGILDVDDVETSVVALTVSDNTNTTHVTTTSDHDDGAGVELDEVCDLASGEVNLDSVVDLDQRVRVADAVRIR